jgi:hypothetical protein
MGKVKENFVRTDFSSTKSFNKYDFLFKIECINYIPPTETEFRECSALNIINCDGCKHYKPDHNFK